MPNQTLNKTIELIEQKAKENQSRAEEIKVRHPKLNVGECYRQGDLYIFKVSPSHPRGKEIQRRQLADGESIGQRHMLIDGEFKIYEGIKSPIPCDDLYVKTGCVGYAFEVLSSSCRNAHPEHDHFILEPGHYQVWHQVDLQTLKRVAD